MASGRVQDYYILFCVMLYLLVFSSVSLRKRKYLILLDFDIIHVFIIEACT